MISVLQMCSARQSRGCRHLKGDGCLYDVEASFNLSGYINSQNVGLWSVEISTKQSLNLYAWCAASRWKIIGPIFFRETTTAEACQEFTMNLISLQNVNEEDCWFQQERAKAHKAN
jgi:hypothetical protein